MKLFDFTLRFNGFDINKAKQVLHKIQKLSDSDFEKHILDKRMDIVEHHKSNNPFYQNLIKDLDIKSWEHVPIMTKQDLQRPLKERLSKGFTNKNVYINKTSGSSGDPFIFAKDKFCHALTWAEIIDRFGWYNIDFNTSKQARFYGIPLDKKGYYKERIKDVFSNRYRFSIFDLSDDAFEKCLKKFKSSKFDFINGYTSPIVQFAKFLKEKNIILNTVCPSLKSCVVTSEILFESDKKLMEQQFGVPVINEYGASELDLIAFQNPKNEWQLNSETLFVEILDDQNMPVPDGKEGRVVITSLYNKAHPFIRYDIGDIGVKCEKSTLKKPLLKTLIGRTNDIAVLPSGKKAAGLTFYYITKTVIEEDANVKEFIIEQHTLDTFKILYVSKEPISETKETIIIQEMEKYLEPNLNVVFERKTSLDRSNRGKLKQFKSFI